MLYITYILKSFKLNLSEKDLQFILFDIICTTFYIFELCVVPIYILYPFILFLYFLVFWGTKFVNE